MHRLATALSILLSVAAAHAATDLTGIVVDANSLPIAAAHVYVYRAHPKSGVSAVCLSCYRDCGKHVQVDAKGSFVLKNLDPTLLFDVLAVADGYEPAFAKRVDPISGPVSIKLSPRSAAD
ncbi:MAG TPA: carboxypeptidase-like regulatory domain-containing protein, partial [Thermoanaerobaculia bacterium]|nr:carboxypeptidase-like regulatory domain-containing protein [Thermoanaerobaculia bacterium]